MRIKRLYHSALEFYFHLRPLRLKELFKGTKAWEDYWVRRKRGKDWHGEQKDWIEGYWNSMEHPHRQLLVDAVSGFEPRSILEVGCACAPNLYLLAKKHPVAQIWGVDINNQAIDYGQRRFYKEGIKNVRLARVQADGLLFAENTFDVVLTDAMLIYIGRDKILGVMERIIDIAGKGLVLIERHIEGVGGLGVYRDGLWQRDYRKLLSEFVPEAQIKITPIAKDVWAEWSETGCIIEVRL